MLEQGRYLDAIVLFNNMREACQEKLYCKGVATFYLGRANLEMAEYDKAIPPGQEGKISVKIIGHKIHPGPFKKGFTVLSNDPNRKHLKLIVTGEIKKVFEEQKYLSVVGFTDDELKAESILTSRRVRSTRSSLDIRSRTACSSSVIITVPARTGFPGF